MLYIVLIIYSHKVPTVNSGNQVFNRLFTEDPTGYCTKKLTGTWMSDVDCMQNEGFSRQAFLFSFGQTILLSVSQPFCLDIDDVKLFFMLS